MILWKTRSVSVSHPDRLEWLYWLYKKYRNNGIQAWFSVGIFLLSSLQYKFFNRSLHPFPLKRNGDSKAVTHHPVDCLSCNCKFEYFKHISKNIFHTLFWTFSYFNYKDDLGSTTRRIGRRMELYWFQNKRTYTF